ncbi:MAG TPA: FtsX-like permease family protein [Arachidicoccus sp.]|nr:FtsX-like permease family protein [Arachidicoccus sp.]
MLHALLKKIIKSGAGRFRYILAMAGLAIALLLILSAIQLQTNYWRLLHGNNTQDSIANFLVINQIVTDQNVGNTNLTEAAIGDLKAQPFIQEVGVVTPSRFKVAANGGTAMPFYTDMFFESVPNQFLDISSKDWEWNDQSQFIPIVIPNQFLDMYNFGFARSQNLPQLSHDLIKSIPIQIDIQAPDGGKHYFAKVVGFSDRISSILVPQAFMDWANAHFATEPPKGASRVIIRTDDPSNPKLMEYLNAHHLTTDLEKTRFSKYRQIVAFVVQISGFTGVAMFLFALLIFSLFIELTIASCREEIRLLVTLGASPRQLKHFLLQQFFPSNVYIALIVLGVLSGLQWLLYRFLQSQSMVVSAFISPITIGGAVLVLLILWWVHVRTIKKQIGT